MAEVEIYEEEPMVTESESLAVAQPAELPDVKLFGRWSCDDVQVSDMSLQVNLHLLYNIFITFRDNPRDISIYK